MIWSCPGVIEIIIRTIFSTHEKNMGGVKANDNDLVSSDTAWASDILLLKEIETKFSFVSVCKGGCVWPG